jgi:hypothetical protein
LYSLETFELSTIKEVLSIGRKYESNADMQVLKRTPSRLYVREKSEEKAHGRHKQFFRAIGWFCPHCKTNLDSAPVPTSKSKAVPKPKPDPEAEAKAKREIPLCVIATLVALSPNQAQAAQCHIIDEKVQVTILSRHKTTMRSPKSR